MQKKEKKMFETDLCHKTAQENFTKRELGSNKLC